MKKKVGIMILSIIVILVVGVSIVYFTSRINMKLNGNDTIVIKLGESYEDEGVNSKFLLWDIKSSSTNNIDINKVGEYNINYKSSILNKSKTIKRTIKVVDGQNPTITLTGDKQMTLYVDGTFKEPGYTANDNYDGDITDKVTVENNVDVKKVGTYEIVYKVVDSSNNEASESRTVKVIEKQVISETSTQTATQTVSKKGHGLPVLMYHFFYDPDNGEKGKDGNWMNIKLFDEQVKYLTDEGYYFPSWQEVIDYVNGTITLPDKSVVITADDGNESFFRLAVPVIRKYNAKATGFIVGSWTNRDYLLLFEDNNIDFQSHTYDMHKGGCANMGHGGYFNCVSYNTGVEDLKKSIENVGDNKAIAYPFGDVNSNVKKITQDAGIILGFTTAYGKVYPGMDKLELPRVRMSDGTSLTAFKNKL